MTLTPKHAQFFVNAELEDHLADNGETLIELLTAIGDPKAMSALSRLLSSNVCCAKCHARDLQIVIECLCGVFETSAATRPDFDAAVRWHGARMQDLQAVLAG